MRRRRSLVLLLVLTFGVSFWGTSVTPQPLPRLTRQQVEAVLRLGKNLVLRDLSGLDLTGLNFRAANLREANLTAANLEGVVLDGANLRRAVLVRANLRGAQLAGADFAEADLTEANLERVSGARSTWTGATLQGARLEGANLEQAQMLGTRLERSNLRGASLIEGYFIRARFHGASLVGAKFDQATLTLASFIDTDLTGASLRFARLNGTDFSGANIDGAAFAYADVTEALNLDTTKNTATATWADRPAATPKSTVATTRRPVIARIIPRNGDPVAVEALDERAEIFLYTRDGATYGMPKTNVSRIEDGQGRVLREFVHKVGPLRVGADCTRPVIGDSATYVENYLRCMAKHKVHATLSQGVSTKTAAEMSGRVAEPAATGARLQRWELRDDQGRLVEVYEALGGSVTLASE